jgi:hypothetical protein
LPLVLLDLVSGIAGALRVTGITSTGASPEVISVIHYTPPVVADYTPPVVAELPREGFSLWYCWDAQSHWNHQHWGVAGSNLCHPLHSACGGRWGGILLTSYWLQITPLGWRMGLPTSSSTSLTLLWQMRQGWRAGFSSGSHPSSPMPLWVLRLGGVGAYFRHHASPRLQW